MTFDKYILLIINLLTTSKYFTFYLQIAFKSLIDCSATRNGDLVALDSSSCKLYLMDRHGRVIVSIDSRKELCGRFIDPTSVTADHFNDIYVSDKDRVLKVFYFIIY